MARLAKLAKVVNEQDGKADLNTEDMASSLATLDGGWRWRWSVKQLSEQTGLHAESIAIGKYRLHRNGILGNTRYGIWALLVYGNWASLCYGFWASN